MRTPLLKSPDTLQVSVLNCDVEERNATKKETFSLLWEDLTMEVRRQERTTVLEWNRIHHERYAKQHQDTFVVQKSPTLKLQMGRLGEKMQVYHLPYKNVLPVPLFTPSKLPSKHLYVSQEHKNGTEISTKGSTSEKRAVEQITKALQPTKPSFKVSNFIPQQSIRCPSMH